MYDESLAPEEEEPTQKLPGTPRIVSRDDHCISRKNIDGDAIKVMGRLIRHGFQAFLVGGGVRDLLLGRIPKDYDIGTNARPEEVRKLFRNSRIIGRRFRLIHVFFYGNKIFEVSTFRKDSVEPEAEGTEVEIDMEDIVPQKFDNEWGDPLTDAFRRDLTINGLFYDLETRSIIDYVGGLEDLEKRVIRMIGDPEVRFREDPVRMIRAVRHAARTGFQIDAETEAAIIRCGELLKTSSNARVYEEFLRELQGGFALESFKILHRVGLLKHLLPALAEKMEKEGEASEIFQTLRRLDKMVAQRKNIPSGVVFASLLVTGLTEEYLEKLAEDSESLVKDIVAEEFGEEDSGFEGELRDGVLEEQEDPPSALEDSEQSLSPSGDTGGEIVVDEAVENFPSQASNSIPQETLDENQARRKIEKLCSYIINQVLVPLAVPRRDRDITQALLYARSVLIYSKACEESNQNRNSRRRRMGIPELLPALCELTGETRIFRAFFRGADFQKTPEPRQRRRRRRRRPYRQN